MQEHEFEAIRPHLAAVIRQNPELHAYAASKGYNLQNMYPESFTWEITINPKQKYYPGHFLFTTRFNLLREEGGKLVNGLSVHFSASLTGGPFVAKNNYWQLNGGQLHQGLVSEGKFPSMFSDFLK